MICVFRLGGHPIASVLSPVRCLFQGSYLISLGNKNQITLNYSKKYFIDYEASDWFYLGYCFNFPVYSGFLIRFVKDRIHFHLVRKPFS